MEKHIALHNFSNIQKEFPPPLPKNIAEQIHDFFMRPVRPAEISDDMRKNYASILLAGAMSKESESLDTSNDIFSIEAYMKSSVMHLIEIPCKCIVCHYDTFEFAREELWENEPELILEIAREQYERVWTGWTKGKDMGEVVYSAKHFWEPLINDILAQYSGCKADWNGNNDSINMAFKHSLTALLYFGKSGHFGIPFHVLMSAFGVLIPAFPICIDKDSHISEVTNRIINASGMLNITPSILEEFFILESFAKTK